MTDPQAGPKVRRSGISVLSGGSDSAIDVVLLHGLNGHPKNTWTHSDTGFFWPAELGRIQKNARIMTYGYDADVNQGGDTNFVRIKELGGGLLAALSDRRFSKENINRPLIFIAHSLGGLIVKAALFEASLNGEVDGHIHIYTSTRGIVFMGTPHLGSTTGSKTRVQVLKMVAKAAFVAAVPPNIERALISHSEELFDLADNFRRVSLWQKQELTIYSFFETEITRKLGDFVVDRNSAQIGYNQETMIPIQSDHQSMVKFEDLEDAYFETVKSKIGKMISNILDKPLLETSLPDVPRAQEAQGQSMAAWIGGAAALSFLTIVGAVGAATFSSSKSTPQKYQEAASGIPKFNQHIKDRNINGGGIACGQHHTSRGDFCKGLAAEYYQYFKRQGVQVHVLVFYDQIRKLIDMTDAVDSNGQIIPKGIDVQVAYQSMYHRKGLAGRWGFLVYVCKAGRATSYGHGGDINFALCSPSSTWEEGSLILHQL